MAPVSTDTVLMEAAQIVDEWPLLEKRVGSLSTIYRRAPGVEKLNLVVHQKNTPEGTLSVSRPEAETWRWIDGRRKRRRHHGAGFPLRLRGAQGHGRT